MNTAVIDMTFANVSRILSPASIVGTSVWCLGDLRLHPNPGAQVVASLLWTNDLVLGVAGPKGNGGGNPPPLPIDREGSSACGQRPAAAMRRDHQRPGDQRDQRQHACRSEAGVAPVESI